MEDDERMSALLKRGLEREGHVATLAADGAEGFDFAVAHAFALVILDVMLPVMDGYEFAQRLLDQGLETPILMLTARDASKDVVTELDAGSDDYLTKPFSFDELLARVRALSRRAPVSRGTTLSVSDLTLDPASHRMVPATLSTDWR